MPEQPSEMPVVWNLLESTIVVLQHLNQVSFCFKTKFEFEKMFIAT
jgi:hypothetical protein